MSDVAGLTKLGSQKTKYYDKPDIRILETFDNQHQDFPYLVPFICTEFTSLCPKTGQPDFATIEILYIPRVKMVESKSLKLYLFSYRNQGEFHEDVINRIWKDLWEVLDPKYLRIYGNFNIRGGIAIKPMRVAISEDTDEEEKLGYREMVKQFDRIK
jgi:7-cyano-7-deazaguanine reductase